MFTPRVYKGLKNPEMKEKSLSLLLRVIPHPHTSSRPCDINCPSPLTRLQSRSHLQFSVKGTVIVTEGSWTSQNRIAIFSLLT